MLFKNYFEKRCYEASVNVLGNNEDIALFHNKRLRAAFSFEHGLISFTGPPAKEIDVLGELKLPRHHSISLAQGVKFLVSCKYHRTRNTKSPPSHIQEWANVIAVIQKFSKQTTYFGMVVSSTGFTSGCSAWAIANNIGLVPPYIGKAICYHEADVLRLYQRVLTTTRRVLDRGNMDLAMHAAFYWHVYKVAADFQPC